MRIYLRRARACSCTSWPTELAIVSPATRAFPDTYQRGAHRHRPYRFQERRKGESVLLERFEGYWGKRPHYPQVQFRIVPEVATRESLLLANQVEMIIQPPLSDLPALQRNPNLKVLLAPTVAPCSWPWT